METNMTSSQKQLRKYLLQVYHGENPKEVIRNLYIASFDDNINDKEIQSIVDNYKSLSNKQVNEVLNSLKRQVINLELNVKNFKELNKFEDIVSPILLSGNIGYTDDTKTLDGEIVLGNKDRRIKVHVTNSKSNIDKLKLNKYSGSTKGKNFAADSNDSITNSPDLPNQVNIKLEDTGYPVDFTEHCKELLAKAFDIGLSELDDRDNQ